MMSLGHRMSYRQHPSTPSPLRFCLHGAKAVRACPAPYWQAWLSGYELWSQTDLGQSFNEPPFHSRRRELMGGNTQHPGTCRIPTAHEVGPAGRNDCTQ